MKFILSLILIFSNALALAATGLEENPIDEKQQYLFKPLNHMRTHVFVGATYFNISGDSELDAKPGFTVGVNAESGQGLSFLIGVKYSVLNSEADISTITQEVQLDYLSLILGGKYYFSGTNSGFFAKANIDPSLLINASVKNGTDDFKDFNLFGQIGLGYIFPGATQFIIDLTYNHGLLDISKLKSNESNIQGFGLNFGLLF